MKLILGLLALTLAACTSTTALTSAPQNYRLKGNDEPIKITGYGTHKMIQGAFSGRYETTVNIDIDGQNYIRGMLDQQLTGDFEGLPYKGKSTSASCSSKVISPSMAEIRCLVFIDNEKTITLTF